MKKENPSPKNNGKELILPKEIQDSFHSVLKRGIYRELHQRNLLSDSQLNTLLENRR